MVLTLLPVGSLISLHPYQHTHFNWVVNGLGGAYGKYETDYWVTSYREAMEWIAQQAARQPQRSFWVQVAVTNGAGETVAPFTPSNAKIQLEAHTNDRQLPPPFDYYIATTRYGMDRLYPDSPIVHTVGREGAVFTVVRARQQAPPH